MTPALSLWPARMPDGASSTALKLRWAKCWNPGTVRTSISEDVTMQITTNDLHLPRASRHLSLTTNQSTKKTMQ